MQAPRSLTSRDKRLDAVNFGCVSSEVQIIHLLKVQPEIGGCAECPPDAQRRIGRDCATAMNDFIDADAVLTFPVATQRFEAVGRRKPKVSQISRRNNTLKPYPRSTQDREGQAANSESLEYLFGALVLEPLHDLMITQHVNNVKGYY